MSIDEGAARARNRTAATVSSNLDASRYDHAAALTYAAHHAASLRNRLTTWREQSLLRRALARISPLNSILDIPCGAGRFFPVLLDVPAAQLTAADNSEGMLAIAARSAAVRSGRIRLVRTSLFNMELDDACVDCVICLRLLHHIALADERMHALRELHRVTCRFAVISLWVDGNLQALRRNEPRLATKGYNRRGWLPRDVVVHELAKCRFRVLTHYDLAPGLSMWRFYVLEKERA